MNPIDSHCRLCHRNLRMIWAAGRGYEFELHLCQASSSQETT